MFQSVSYRGRFRGVVAAGWVAYRRSLAQGARGLAATRRPKAAQGRPGARLRQSRPPWRKKPCVRVLGREDHLGAAGC
jgi:hypothetical protein